MAFFSFFGGRQSAAIGSHHRFHIVNEPEKARSTWLRSIFEASETC